ncbi:MAG TPA: conjugal transfer protein TrbE [Alphaproteobacteria bacterium]|nr:conjugal transfer protein TrbE [Alphaproteobacteria bacterium]
MMNLAEYRRRPDRLSDYLPWAALIAPGIVLNKDGSLQRTARFRGPDLESATQSALVGVAARLNNALRRFGSGWALFAEAQRVPADSYPESTFPDPVSWLVDEERRAMFEAEGAHFESRYFLTFLFLPPAESKARAGDLIFDRATKRQGVDWKEVLAGFIDRTDRALALLDGIMPEAVWLSDAETLTYLHSTISTKHHGVGLPETPMYLDAFLADQPLTGGLDPMLGRRHLRITSVLKFPSATWPGLLDELNALAFPYRWSTRWIALDKPDSIRALTRIRRHWFAKRKSISIMLREILFQRESLLIDSDAHNMALDADEALQELGSDFVSEGYFTATVTVWDEEPARADEKRRLVERIVNGRDFTTIAESVNAVDAWLGSLPGHAYANIRQPPVSSLNLVHMLPMSAVWAGPEDNAHLSGPPLLIAKTQGSTPFRFVTHVGDVGHMMVVGPTGAGKSTLLALMALQFRRYPRSRIFIFDMGGSARAAVAGVGGAWYDLGAGGETGNGIAFQPLRHIDDQAERAWAAEWIRMLLAHERVPITPEVKDIVWSALGSLATAPVEQRTLTGLSVLLQSLTLRQALQPYTLAGPYGRLLDADTDRLGSADLQCFEIEGLMESGAELPVLTYLFHRLEERFDGVPTLMIIDEGWLVLDDPIFADQLREWEKTARKKNVAIIFATQSLSDIERSTIAPAIIESCPTRIFLPNDRAVEPQIRTTYERFGLNERQIEIIARAQPKRDYYFQSRQGNRLFELGLGPATLAFVGASTKTDLARIAGLLTESGDDAFAAAWLNERALGWAADLLESWSVDSPIERSAA